MSNTNEKTNTRPKKEHKFLKGVLEVFVIVNSIVLFTLAIICLKIISLIILGIITAAIFIILAVLKSKKTEPSEKTQKLQNTLTYFLIICVMLLLIWSLIHYQQLFLVILAAAWFISECYAIKEKKTNWFIVIGTVVTIVSGIGAFISYNKVSALREDLGARLENSVVSVINDKAKLELESDISKAENDFNIKLYIAIGGAVLFCVGHIIKASENKKETVVIEKIVEVPASESSSITDNTESKKYIFCQNCGEKLSPTAKFCKNCGESTSE